MELSKRIDNNIWVSIDGELKQLRPLVAQLEDALTIEQLLEIRSRLLLKKEYHKGYLPGLIGGINALIEALGGEQ